MEQIRFDNQVIIITGAGGGLGYTYAKCFAERGAKLVINDIKNAEKTVEEVKAMGAEAVADNSDISTYEGAKALIDKAVEAFGKIDVVVNNAGVCRSYLFEDEPFDVFDFIMKVNVYGTRNVSYHAYKVMKEQGYGKIINTTSTGGLFGLVRMGAYSASKGAVCALTRYLASEGEAYNIQVNAVAPGAATPMTLGSDTNTSVNPEVRQRVIDTMPAELVFPVVALLARKECNITGRFFESCAGHVDEAYMASTVGFVDFKMTPESLLANWDIVTDQTDYHVYANGMNSQDGIPEAIEKQQGKVKEP